MKEPVEDKGEDRLESKTFQEAKRLFETIFNNSAAAIIVTDQEDIITAWNPFTEKMLGMNRKELFNMPVKDLYPDEEWQRMCSLKKNRQNMMPEVETRLYKKGGDILDVSVSLSFLKEEGEKTTGAIRIIRDITEQKRVREMLLKSKTTAEEASRAKSLFLANMSHEVRTPMNTILGMIDLTLDTELTEEQRDNLTTVKTAADILLSLLNDILDLSRAESGKVQLEEIEFNIKNIIKSVCKGLSVLAREKGLELAWDIAGDVPEILIGDPVRIRQVLVNLINNAIKFTFKGKIMTTVKVNSVKAQRCELQVAVTDEGVGISKDKTERIFEDFTQADASTTRQFGGTGLGLSISKKLVEMMQGRIWVESEEFKGSTFFFTAQFNVLPKAQDTGQVLSATEESSVPAPLGDQPESSLRQLTILLAEDNIVNQTITARMLEKRGWTVKTADNGKEALTYLEKEPFDLILMDAQMPVLDGYEATRSIRESEKKTGKHIPIIALTARAMTGDREKCLDSGMDGYVSKPIDRPVLYGAIEDLLLKRSAS